MRAYFYQCGIWTGTDSLWHGLGLNGRIKQARSGKGPGPFVVSFAGAGGKTSTIRRLAWEAVGRGLKVLVVTTTHMARPGAFGVFDGNAEEIRTVLEHRGLAVAGRTAEKEKITFTGWELYKEACSLADLVLVEADGSRRLPLKVPRAGEPVIPDNTDMILCLNGLTSLGKRAEDCCLRLEEAGDLMKRYGRKMYEDSREQRGSGTDALELNAKHKTDWIIQKEDMMTLMKHGYLLPLRAAHPGTEVLPVFNQADTPQEAALAGEMLDCMGETSGIACGHLDKDGSARLF